MDKTSDQGGIREDHEKISVPTLLKKVPGVTGRASIKMALPDLGNLLAHAVIDAEFHERLGIPTKDTKIRARAANKQSMEIREV